jgi:aminoglycoside/choline kinase family phosphotransferase
MAKPPLPLSGTSPDERLALVREWVQALAPGHGLDPATLRPASSDASFRRYFRITRTQAQANSSGGTNGSLIVMDAPPERENCGAWLRVGDLLRRAGVRVPALHAADEARGLLLLEDLGSTSLWDAAQEGEGTPFAGDGCDRRMRAAIETLVEMQGIALAGDAADAAATALPAYDEARFRMELGIFREWYVGRHLEERLTPAEDAALGPIFDALVATALAQPQVVVHRDYHSRNLMVLAGADAPGVLDFQDAVRGPVSYDLASLLRDAYLDWPAERQLDWAARYWDLARRAGVPVTLDFGAFWRDLEWMGLQRSLKVLGIFARLNHRDGKPGYLPFLPRVLGQAWDVAQRYDLLRPLAHLLDRVNGRTRPSGFSF